MIYFLYAHKLLMAAATILLTYAVSAAYFKKESWFATHRTFATLGVTCGLFGFAAIFIFKMSMGYPHLKTIHAIAGLAAILLFTGAPLAGKLLVSGKKSLRAAHVIGGRLALLATIASLLLKVI